MRQLLLGLGGAAFAVLIGMQGAQALTITSSGGTNPDGSPRFVDPDAQMNHLSDSLSNSPSSNGMSTNVFHSGSTTFSFGFSNPQGGGGGFARPNDFVNSGAMTGRQYFFGQ